MRKKTKTVLNFLFFTLCICIFTAVFLLRAEGNEIVKAVHTTKKVLKPIPSLGKFTPYPTGLEESCDQIKADAEGTLWMTFINNSFLGSLDPKSNLLNYFPTPTSRSAPDGLTVDSSGRIWFGQIRHPTGGLGMFDPKKRIFREIIINKSVLRVSLAIPSTDKDGNIMITAHQANSLYQFSNKDGSLDSIWKFETMQWPTDVVADKNNTIWISAVEGKPSLKPGGLIRLERNKNIVTIYPLPDENTKAHWLAYDEKRHVLYVSAGSKGFFEFDIEKEAYTHFVIPGDQHLLPISLLPSGALAIGNKKSIDVFDPLTGEFQSFPLPEGEDGLRDGLTADQEGRIWFCNTKTKAVWRLDTVTARVALWDDYLPLPDRELILDTRFEPAATHGLRSAAVIKEAGSFVELFSIYPDFFGWQDPEVCLLVDPSLLANLLRSCEEEAKETLERFSNFLARNEIELAAIPVGVSLERYLKNNPRILKERFPGIPDEVIRDALVRNFEKLGELFSRYVIEKNQKITFIIAAGSNHNLDIDSSPVLYGILSRRHPNVITVTSTLDGLTLENTIHWGKLTVDTAVNVHGTKVSLGFKEEYYTGSSAATVKLIKILAGIFYRIKKTGATLPAPAKVKEAVRDAVIKPEINYFEDKVTSGGVLNEEKLKALLIK